MRQTPLRVFLAARLLLSALGLALWLMNLVPPLPDPTLTPCPEYPVRTPGLAAALFGVWQRYDVLRYMQIASAGYCDVQASVYYPAFPSLMRLAAPLLGGNLLLSGLAVSNLAFGLALVQLQQLLLEDGFEAATIQRALIYLTFSPPGFFFLIPYTEALFLLFAVCSLYWARHGHWGKAALAGFLVALTRFQGVGLAPVMAFEVFRQRGWRFDKSWTLLLFSLTPFLGWGLFNGWRLWAGFPSVIDIYARVWGRFPALPGWGLLLTAQRMVTGSANPIEYFDFTMVVAMLGLGVVVIRRLPATYSLYHWILLILNLSQYQVGNPLSGAARFGLVLFPAFAVLAMSDHSLNWRRLILLVFGLGWAYHAAVFILMGFVG